MVGSKNEFGPQAAGGRAPRLDELRRLRDQARLLDSAFQIPGTNFRIGWDGLIGLIPGVGDAVTGVLAAGLVARAAHLGVPNRVLFRMVANVAVDIALGAVPVLGDLFDIAWKANQRNVRLLERHVARAERQWAPPDLRHVPVARG